MISSQLRNHFYPLWLRALTTIHDSLPGRIRHEREQAVLRSRLGAVATPLSGRELTLHGHGYLYNSGPRALH